jgi:hypothetical protein
MADQTSNDHIATIEIRSKYVLGEKITKYAPQHLYIIHKDSSGKETILRGGTGLALVDDLHIVVCEYTYDNRKAHKDWDLGLKPDKTGIPTHLRKVVTTGSDEQIQSYVNKMWQRAEAINREGFDYKIPFIGHVQNSNTAVKEMLEAAGLPVEMPKNNDGSNIWVPGADGHFTHTFLDTITDQTIIPNLRSAQYKKEPNADYSQVTYINKDTGTKVYVENTGLKIKDNFLKLQPYDFNHNRI